MIKTLEGVDTSDPKESVSYASVTLILASVALGCAFCWTIPTLACGYTGVRDNQDPASPNRLIP
jgi:hypothetical protein